MVHSTSAFYSYVLARPDGVPFYVGKGRGKRMNDLSSNRSLHFKNLVKKHGAENILKSKMECSSESIAFELEIGLIKCMKRSGFVLVNKTDGGEGPSGFVFSAHSRLLMSEKQKEYWKDAARRQAVSERNKKYWTEESRNKFSESVKKRGVSTFNKISKALKEHWANNDKEILRAASKKAWDNKERRKALSDRNAGKRWITDGTENKFVCVEEANALIENGWRYGRSKFR